MTVYCDPQKEVIYRIMELLPTVDEAMIHMVGQLEGQRLDESAALFHDVLRAIGSIGSSIEKNLSMLTEQDSEDAVGHFTAHVREAIRSVINGYEARDLATVQTLLIYRMLPAFGEWRRHLERILQPQILS
jgi:hypothetical protein